VKTRAPTLLEIEELVAFLPRLYAEGFTPVVWRGGEKIEEGGAGTPYPHGDVYQMPWPKYDDIVCEFVEVAERECWTDPEYMSKNVGQVLRTNEDAIEAADLNEIKTILTFFVRGERFCSGHWGAMIEGGAIRRLLQRLTELESIGVQPDTPPDSNSADDLCS
jgi:hypothetical protein